MKMKSTKRRHENEDEVSAQKSKKNNVNNGSNTFKNKNEQCNDNLEAVSGPDAKVKKSHKNLRKKYKKNKSHEAALPVKPDDISSNWKNLMKTLEAEKSDKKKNPIVFFSAKRRKRFNEVKSYSVKKQVVEIEEEPKKKPEIWFDDVDETLLDPEDRPNLSIKSGDDYKGSNPNAAEKALVKERAFKG